MNPLPDRYYLEHLIALSASEKIVFIEDVYNESRVKLVDAGAVFNGKLYELLHLHKLQKPLDELIVIVDRIGISDVVARARQLEKRTPYLQALVSARDSKAILFNAIDHITLGGKLANELTVMHKRLPELYDHSIQVALVAAAIGRELSLPAPLLTMLVMAGLLHDLGELHLEPQLLDTHTRFTESQWRRIYEHPQLSYMLLAQCAEVPAPVARAVLEHHERMDGSGYPHNKPGEQLCKPGRILAAADVLTAICQREVPAHVGTVFKAYVSNLDATVVQAVNALLLRMQTAMSTAQPAPPEVRVDIAELAHLCDKTSRIMRAWKILAPKLEANPLERVRRLQARLFQIEIALLNAGIDPENCAASLRDFADEPPLLQEIFYLLRELNYQFSAIVNETQRSWNFDGGKKSTATQSVEKWLKQISA